MKKTLLIAAVAGLLFTSCKENKKEEVLETAKVENAVATPPATNTEEDMIKEAQSKPLTNIALSETNFDFGKIKKGEKVSHVYEVTNTGENPLIISQVKPGCGCTAPEFTKEPIMPGKKGQITLAFDSSSFDGMVSKQAHIYANTEKTPILLTFSADIQP